MFEIAFDPVAAGNVIERKKSAPLILGFRQLGIPVQQVYGITE